MTRTLNVLLPTNETLFLSHEDRDLIALQWYVNGRYVIATESGKHVYVHRIVLERKLGRPLASGEYADHINGHRLDARRRNLRVASPSQNVWNRRKCSRPTKSQYVGVFFDPARKCRPWAARIAVYGRRIRLGCYDSELEAAYVYDQAALQLRGEYAHLNVL